MDRLRNSVDVSLCVNMARERIKSYHYFTRGQRKNLRAKEMFVLLDLKYHKSIFCFSRLKQFNFNSTFTYKIFKIFKMKFIYL